MDQRKAFSRKRIPESSYVRKKTSRNGERKIIQLDTLAKAHRPIQYCMEPSISERPNTQPEIPFFTSLPT